MVARLNAHPLASKRRTAIPCAASLLLLVATVGCGESSLPTLDAPCSEQAAAGAPLGTRCGQLVDPEGRVRFLRGVNARVEGVFDVTFDDGRVALEEVPPFDATDPGDLRSFGFDALRLPINWSGIEPTEDGGLDEAYLQRIDEVVALAKSAGVMVLLDLHQDAYSKEIGEDGAPLWAIRPPPDMLLEGPLTDLAERITSPQVLRAFATFFDDDEGEGPYLRERYVQMASAVAARYASEPSVIGLELFNEPVAGDPRVWVLNELAYPEIRAAAPDKLFLFEPAGLRNQFDTAPVGTPLGPMSVYAPHIYTKVFIADAAVQEALTKDDLRPSMEGARAEAQGWEAPLVVTEFGADPKVESGKRILTWQLELQEELLASSFLWLWKEQSQGNWGCHSYDEATDSFSPREEVRALFARPRVQAVSGWPLSMQVDRSSGEMRLRFWADPAVSAPHRVLVPPALGEPLGFACDGAEVLATALEHGEHEVACGGGDEREHELVVRVTPSP
jgi:endoglycosylceramidase